MAYITIHPIKSTLQKAVDYICDPEKTDNHKNISCCYCDYRTAEKMFARTKTHHSQNMKNLAFHMIQSFKISEVTPEQAHDIGAETMRRFLGNQYEFIVATHSDTNHVHNHIIINSVNMINGKSFSREHDRKADPAWLALRKISDEILVENGLSVITQPEKTGKSHYEWSMDKSGKSWKSKLKYIIDETIRSADDFDGFLEQIQSQNITVKYEPYKTKDGMILAFKMDGQKNFIYSQKLGKYYHENTIKERIERCVRRRGMSKTERRMERILNDDGKLKRLYDVDSMDGEYLKLWAKKENRQIKMSTLIELRQRGFMTADQLFDYTDELREKIAKNDFYYKDMTKIREELIIQIKYAEIYNDYKDIYYSYKNETFFPDRYFRWHEKEILLFEEAKTELEKFGINTPNIDKLKDDLAMYERYIGRCKERGKELSDELKSYDVLAYNLGVIYPEYADRTAERTFLDVYNSEQADEPSRAFETVGDEAEIQFDENNYEIIPEPKPEPVRQRSWTVENSRDDEKEISLLDRLKAKREVEPEPQREERYQPPKKRCRSDDFDMEL